MEESISERAGVCAAPLGKLALSKSRLLTCHRHLTPGGYFEQVEIDWIPGWEGTDIPAQSSLLQWAEQFLQGMDGFQRSV